MIVDVDRDILIDLMKEGKRIDGRGLMDYRKIEITTGISRKAEGSAEVRLGDTRVMAGVKLDIGKPFPDTPEEGVFMVNAEFVPFASETFEAGPPDENAIELARVVDRAIREAKIFDNSQLVVEPGEAVWMVFVDLDILDHGGNLIDASSLAAISALLNARFPQYEKQGDEYRVLYDEEKTDEKLKISRIPVSVTFGKIGDNLFVDPSILEENQLDARITCGVFEEGLSSVQKGLAGGFRPREIEELAEKAMELGNYLRGFLK